MLCGSLDNLPASFAALDGVDIEGTTPLVRDHRDLELQRRVQQLLQGAAPDDGPESDTDTLPANCQQSVESAELTGLSEPELRARCAKVFGADDRAPGVAGEGKRSGKSTRTNKAIPTNTPKTTPLGKLRKRMAGDLEGAGYSPSTCRTLLMYARLFASFHKRSPLNLGNDHVVGYLRHLVLDKNVSLTAYRNARTSLVFLYEVTLLRPEEVDQLPLNPGDLCEAEPTPENPPGLRAGPGPVFRPAGVSSLATPVS